MDAAQLIQIAVQASIWLLVFALGLGASHEDATVSSEAAGFAGAGAAVDVL